MKIFLLYQPNALPTPIVMYKMKLVEWKTNKLIIILVLFLKNKFNKVNIKENLKKKKKKIKLSF